MSLKIIFSGIDGSSPSQLEVLHSGFCLSNGLADTKFELAADFSFILRLSEVESESDQAINSSLIENAIRLDIKVTAGTNGYGWATPRPAGRFNGRRIWIALRIDTYGQPITGYGIAYTFSLGEAMA